MQLVGVIMAGGRGIVKLNFAVLRLPQRLFIQPGEKIEHEGVPMCGNAAGGGGVHAFGQAFQFAEQFVAGAVVVASAPPRSIRPPV